MIFVLELLSFIVFGTSAIFNRTSFIKSVEGSLSYILPAFFSFVCMMLSDNQIVARCQLRLLMFNSGQWSSVDTDLGQILLSDIIFIVVYKQ